MNLLFQEKFTIINPMIVFIMFYKNFVFVKGTRKNTKCRSFVSGSGSTNMLQTAHVCKKMLDLYHILNKKRKEKKFEIHVISSITCFSIFDGYKSITVKKNNILDVLNFF